MRCPRTRRALLAGLLASAGLLPASAALSQPQPSFLTFESGHVRPLALSPDGTQLFAVNTPDNRLEIFDLDGNGELVHTGAVQVGMEPVAVAARSNDEVWVVNHLSDSVSVVDLSGSVPRVVRTLLVGDEPNDIVFAGPKDGNDFFERAFITTAHRGQNSPYPRGEYDQEGIGRADVWVFDATSLGSSLGGDEIAIITLFGDKPRALAATSDGSTVYAAIFRSGNQTTTLNEAFVCDTSNGNMNSNQVQGPCSVARHDLPRRLSHTAQEPAEHQPPRDRSDRQVQSGRRKLRPLAGRGAGGGARGAPQLERLRQVRPARPGRLRDRRRLHPAGGGGRLGELRERRRLLGPRRHESLQHGRAPEREDLRFEHRRREPRALRGPGHAGRPGQARGRALHRAGRPRARADHGARRGQRAAPAPEQAHRLLGATGSRRGQGEEPRHAARDGLLAGRQYALRGGLRLEEDRRLRAPASSRTTPSPPTRRTTSSSAARAARPAWSCRAIASTC